MTDSSQKSGRANPARRSFLKRATLASSATLAAPFPLTKAAAAQAGSSSLPATRRDQPPQPDIAAETMPAPEQDPVTQDSSGGEYIVDVLKSLGIEYLPLNPASTFRGLQEAIVNYGKNTMPQLITCTHEEISVHIAQGYSKIAGKPLAVLAHGTVGLQHAAMALYNAWCDRTPVVMLVGNLVDATKRQSPGVGWVQSAIDPGALVRDFTKWDDQPASLQHCGESLVRAYKIATTPPMGPVLISLDKKLQEDAIPPSEKLHIPKLSSSRAPQGESGAVAEAAAMLVNAESPVLVVDRMVRTPAGMGHMVELAEALQCPVIDMGGRSNFPTRHPLCHSARPGALLPYADVIMGIEVADMWGRLNALVDRIVMRERRVARADVKTITLGLNDVYIGKANYQDFQRYAAVDLAIAGDGEATLPLLTEEVKRLITARRRSVLQARGKGLAEDWRALIARVKRDATIGWDSSPVTTARLSAELYNQIADEDWSLVGNGIGINWPRTLWDFDKPYRWIGGSGGAGLGYTVAGSLGAALANKAAGRISVTINGDGDFMFSPGTLWTAAHHRIPILYIIHNNRAYHQELMWVQVMANRNNRTLDVAHSGTTIDNPNIDFAAMAKSMGVYGEGPISDPRELGPALKRALAVVKRGEPALVDVICEPR